MISDKPLLPRLLN